MKIDDICVRVYESQRLGKGLAVAGKCDVRLEMTVLMRSERARNVTAGEGQENI